MSEYGKPEPPSSDYEVYRSDELPGNILPEGSLYFKSNLEWDKSILIGDEPAPESWYAIPRPWRDMDPNEILHNNDEWRTIGYDDWEPVPYAMFGCKADGYRLAYRTRRKLQEEDQVTDAKNDAIAPGDVVRLKSGGPDMTVLAVDDDRVKCVWFHRESGSWSHQPSRAAFGSFVIKKVSV